TPTSITGTSFHTRGDGCSRITPIADVVVRPVGVAGIDLSDEVVDELVQRQILIDGFRGSQISACQVVEEPSIVLEVCLGTVRERCMGSEDGEVFARNAVAKLEVKRIQVFLDHVNAPVLAVDE